MWEEKLENDSTFTGKEMLWASELGVEKNPCSGVYWKLLRISIFFFPWNKVQGNI